MKIAHISDIHFFCPSFKISHLANSKWLGNLNAYFRRKNYFITHHLDLFLASLVKESVDALIITGDFTTTADEKEFKKGKEFLEKARSFGLTVYALPGNHDTYTKKSFDKKFFYNLLDIPTFSQNQIENISLNSDWELILLDCSMINPLGIANGKFLEASDETLKQLCANGKNLIVANHFPLSGESDKHKLIRGEDLKQILLDSGKQILYLHGHTHKTEYSNEENLHIFNSSEVTVTTRFKYQLLEINDSQFTRREIKYYG